MRRPRSTVLVALAAVVLVAAGGALGARAWLVRKIAHVLLHPPRRTTAAVRAEGDRLTPADAGLATEPFAFEASGGLVLRGWLARPSTARPRGLILFLHGLGDAGARGVGAAMRWVPEGFDVAAYDQRGAGDSEGGWVTYGVLEAVDVHRALDALAARGLDVSRTLLFGCSMGAATAVMAAPGDPRIAGVIAQSPYSSLEDVVAAHLPRWMPRALGRSAIARASAVAGAPLAAAAPALASPSVRVPLLVIASDADEVVPFQESVLVASGTSGPHALVVVHGAGHNDVLAKDAERTWAAIDRFVGAVLPARVPW